MDGVLLFCIASENFGPIANSNGKVLLNGPYANSLNGAFACQFGVIVMAAIFGTSVLRDFQGDTYQMIFTKPISKFVYPGGRWAGSFVTTVLVFFGLVVGTYRGTFAPWADHARIGPNHLAWYLQPFFCIVVAQIFFIGALLFRHRRAHAQVDRCVPAGRGPVHAVHNRPAHDRRHHALLERGRKEQPAATVGFLQIFSQGVFFYNRLLWSGVGIIALAAVWTLFSMSVEALTARSQGKRAAKARE